MTTGLGNVRSCQQHCLYCLYYAKEALLSSHTVAAYSYTYNKALLPNAACTHSTLLLCTVVLKAVLCHSFTLIIMTELTGTSAQ